MGRGHVGAADLAPHRCIDWPRARRCSSFWRRIDYSPQLALTIFSILHTFDVGYFFFRRTKKEDVLVFLEPCYIRDFFTFVDTGVHILAIVTLRSVWHWILDWTMFSEHV